jgi:ribosomal protein L11 methyltransferase
MRYHVIHIQTDFAEAWQCDLFEQQLFDLGVDTIDREDYYIQSEIWEEKADEIKEYCDSTEEVRFLGADECPDENWNAAWEAEHPIQELPLGIKIVPHCAFGAGHHETTSMMIDSLVASNLSDKIVLDHGTGTGVLAIFAKRLGAKQVIAVDIDEKSVENAIENAALNGEQIEVLHTSAFRFQPSAFNVILANIHRNILLDNMHAYAQSLAPNGELWLSGFYEDDCPILQAAAEKEGLQTIQVLANGEWRLMKCRK